MIEMVVGTKVYDPPITAGNRVPKNDCSNVFKPATKSKVWITFAFSSYKNNELQSHDYKDLHILMYNKN